MNVYPNYYNKFKCIADRCKHSCCIGWEIDIDEDTMELYGSLEGELADKIRANIDGEVPHFILYEGERCPFLNKNGLCDIITEYGDGAICDICYLHPRFYNFYSSFEEVGLGLSCEEAVRVVLVENEKFYIETPDRVTDEEKKLLEARQGIFDVLQDRTKTVAERFSEIAKSIEFDFCPEEAYNIYVSLERLDKKWATELEKIKDFDENVFQDNKLQIFFEQLACYFVFRHFKGGVREVKFALLSCCVIGALCFEQDFDKALDIVRMYSSEIEYSEENTKRLMNYLSGGRK